MSKFLEPITMIVLTRTTPPSATLVTTTNPWLQPQPWPMTVLDQSQVLMALNEGGMQYLIAGARANVGLKGGRHMFEAPVLMVQHGIFVAVAEVYQLILCILYTHMLANCGQIKAYCWYLLIFVDEFNSHSSYFSMKLWFFLRGSDLAPASILSRWRLRRCITHQMLGPAASKGAVVHFYGTISWVGTKIPWRQQQHHVKWLVWWKLMETESRSVHFGQFSHLWDKEPSTARNEGCCRFIYQPELHFIIRICSKHVRNMWPVLLQNHGIYPAW